METPTTADERLKAFGNQLIDVHASLREELAGLRDDVAAHLAGRSARPRDLPAHCLAFCSALERHHTGEDAVAFPALAEQFPRLRPVLQELTRDHQIISDILLRLQDLLDGLGGDDGTTHRPPSCSPPPRVRTPSAITLRRRRSRTRCPRGRP